jgi:hypothetical protein
VTQKVGGSPWIWKALGGTRGLWPVAYRLPYVVHDPFRYIEMIPISGRMWK